MNVVLPNQVRAALIRPRPFVRIVIAGHVDHGKSTLIGRLLHETGSLPEGKLDALKVVSARRGMPFEWSFLLDALQSERDQGITIDTSQISFRTQSRDFVLIDAPGHAEFLRNMITGAAQADAAILIVDATEGVRDQTRRHGYLLHLVGLRQVAVVINKMDRVGFDPARFDEIRTEITNYLSNLGVTPAAVIPISARQGDGIARRTASIEWYSGPTVLDALDRFSPAGSAQELALRMPIQAVYKFDDRRIIAGRVESGRIAVGDEIEVTPGAKFASIKSIETWPVRDKKYALRHARAGQSIGIILDRELFIERGNVLSLASAPAKAARNIRARIFWLHKTPLTVGSQLVVRVGTAEARCVVSAIHNAVDPGLLTSEHASSIGQNHVGEIEIALAHPLAADAYRKSPATGRIVLEFEGRIAGGGPIESVDTEEGPGMKSEDQTRNRESNKLTKFVAEVGPALRDFPPDERLARLRRDIAGRIVFTTSFGIEDQAILHMIAERTLEIDVVTLDTGRLFPETYALWEETERRYGRRIRAFYPRHGDLEAMIERQGINGFYVSRENRVSCCHIRKVEPLERALAGANAWIAGLRADQSGGRQELGMLTAEEDRRLVKLCPLFDWTREAVVAFTAANRIPMNSLHEKGFASIGCAPCTRAILPAEPERAGRWWWEDETKKECGLHVNRET